MRILRWAFFNCFFPLGDSQRHVATHHNQFFTSPSQSETPTTQKASTALREAYFLSFASSLRSAAPSTTLMVTGGFRTRAGMRNAVTSQSCDLIGLARPAVLEPSLPKEKILSKDVGEGDAGVVVPRLKANGVMKWLGLESLVSAKVTVSCSPIWFPRGSLVGGH